MGNVKQFKIALFTRLNDGMHLLFKVEMHEKKTYRRNMIDKWSFGIIKYFSFRSRTCHNDVRLL